MRELSQSRDLIGYYIVYIRTCGVNWMLYDDLK